MDIYPYKIDLKVFAMPPDGKEEYIFWLRIFLKISTNLVEIMRILRGMQKLDPEKSVHYDERIDESFHDYQLNMMEWEVKHRELLAKWLRDQ